MGMMLGVGVGLSTLSLRNVLKGATGGWVGGFVGSLFVRPDRRDQSIGAAVAVYHVERDRPVDRALHWASAGTDEGGMARGRGGTLARAAVSGSRGPTATIGRAEENPIGLFGDAGVQPRHAVITQAGREFYDSQSRGAGRHLRQRESNRDGGVARRRSHPDQQLRVSFHSRAGAQRREYRSGAHGIPGGLVVCSGRPRRVGAAASVPQSAANGPAYLAGHNGDRFTLRPGAAARIGRALDNDIVVADASVSRHHATIEAVNGSFTLRDLGSQNGTFIGGARITRSDARRWRRGKNRRRRVYVPCLNRPSRERAIARNAVSR